MANRLWQRIGTTETKLWADPKDYVKADLPGEITALEDILALSDDAKTWLMQNIFSGYASIAEFDDFLQGQVDKLSDILDYFDYATRVENLTVYDGMWIYPQAVESSCGAETGHPVTDMLDNDAGTYWEHWTDEAHELIFKIKDYRKRITKVRFRADGNLMSFWNNLDIYAAATLGGLDLPENKVLTGGSFSTPSDWNELVLDSSKFAIYIKLTGFGSQNANNYVRSREFQVWVSTNLWD